MTIVSSANNIGSDTQFISFFFYFILFSREVHLYVFSTKEALELILGELQISVHPSQRKMF